MTPEQTRIDSLHACWCELTEQELHKASTERLFADFARAGFTTDDLKCLLKYMMRANKKGGGRYKIQLHKVIGDHEVTASILAEARVIERNARKAATASEKIMAAYERPVDPEMADKRLTGNGRHISDVFKNLQQ